MRLMQRLAVGLILSLLIFIPSHATAEFSGQVISVLDGDTIEVLHNNRPNRVRLNGIDCPEKASQASHIRTCLW
jgi:endonuclease YncB( thermonuclease family)